MRRLDELTEEELDEVRLRVGTIVLNLPATAALARHRTPLDPIRGGYLDVYDDEPEIAQIAKQFLIDILSRGAKANDVNAKWGSPFTSSD